MGAPKTGVAKTINHTKADGDPDAQGVGFGAEHCVQKYYHIKKPAGRAQVNLPTITLIPGKSGALTIWFLVEERCRLGQHSHRPFDLRSMRVG